MTCTETLSRALRAQGFRITPQRLLVLEILHQGGHLSAAEVFAQAQQRMPGLTETTVYRTLDFLAQQGAIFTATDENGRLAFEIALHSHHHLLCVRCGATSEIAAELLETCLERIEATSGFDLHQPHLTLRGLCPECRQTRRLQDGSSPPQGSSSASE